MVEKDTVRLLRECDAGIRMGTASLDEVLGFLPDGALRGRLESSKQAHNKLQDEAQVMLDRYGDDGKQPNPMAQGMSWVKTNVRMAMDNSEATVADLMTDGCNMGVKSLARYLNQYAAADEGSKNLAKRVISLEEDLAKDLRTYL